MLKDYLQSFRSLWGIGVIVAAAGPLALALPELTPPWPQGVEAITVIFSAVAAMLAFRVGGEYTRRRAGSKARRRQIALASAALLTGLAGSVAYLAAYGAYVVVETQPTEHQERKLRFVVGTEQREGASSKKSDLELLRNNMYEPENVWTRASLLRARLILFGSFALTFSMLTFGAGLLATVSEMQSRRRAAP